MSNSLRLYGLHSPWNSPGKNTRVGCHAVLQGIFPTQGLNPSLTRCKQILYQQNHQGRSPHRILTNSILFVSNSILIKKISPSLYTSPAQACYFLLCLVNLTTQGGHLRVILNSSCCLLCNYCTFILCGSLQDDSHNVHRSITL